MSSDRSDDDDHDAVSKQIVDYYKKYSQSKQLPKYFSGTALSYMPPIVQNEEIAAYSKPSIVIDDTNSETLVPKPTPEASVEPKAVSPTSSVTSNRKLEWDNGADIGYNNCNRSTNLHKSLSLPILLSSVDNKKVAKSTKPTLSSQVVTVISYHSESDTKDAQINSSSSSSSPYRPEVPIQSSSSSVKTNPKPVSSSSSSFSNTIAYLKSKIGSPDAESTPKITSSSQPQVYIDTPIAPKPKQQIKHRTVNLCFTKPISIQCLDNQKKKASDKKIQTSFAEGVSKSVQTSESLELLTHKTDKEVINERENQSVVFINYNSESDKRTCSSNTQTDAEIIASHCDSFEYYREENLQKKISSKSDLTDSSKDVPVLGQLISQKQSGSLINDVDRSIELLQKLLKSKKYDVATKKRYVKKIVDKIVNTKYSEDSTTSSELFVPKRQPNKDGVPKFSVKTFTDEFVPGFEHKKRSILTSTHQSGDPSVLGTIDSKTSLEKQQNQSSGSYHSWKNDKTESEKLLEEKQRGQGDQLVKFAMKERQHQIAWINDEISHLTKLKGLLEKKSQKTTTVYMVSDCDCLSGNAASGSRGPSPRNYVIETEVSTSSSSGPVDYNLYDKDGTKKNYRVRETSAQANLNFNRKVVRDIEVVSDDKTTNIKVGAKKLEGEDIGMFKPKPPTLIGFGKYDTFPRSKAEEERCWPCGRVRSAKAPNMYSFNVPLTNETNFAEKIQEIINKYTQGKPPNRYDHQCKFRNVLENTRTTPTPPVAPELKPKPEDKIPPMCKCCKCKHQLSPAPDERFVAEITLKAPEPEKKASSSSHCTCCKCKKRTDKVVPPKTRDAACDCSCKVQGVESTQCQTDCVCCNKEMQTDYKCQTEECTCCNKEMQTDDDVNRERMRMSDLESTKSTSQSGTSSTSSTSGTMSSSGQSAQTCLCCKRKNVTEKHLYSLRKKLSEEVYPLCRPCYRQNRMGAYPPNCYNNSTHVCNCYTVVKTKTLNEIKNTINHLNELEEYCTCVNPDNRNTSDYCKYCKCKLKSTCNNRNGIAYMLTFDETLREKKKKHKKPHLEEIKIKIPVSYKKKRKDKENKRKKARLTDDSEEAGSSDVRRKAGSTLQEYLRQNRPDFVEEAEERRQTVNESKALREEMSDYKKLMFLKKCQEECERRAKRLFSGKEMKEITKRNYKKCPEVQQKLNDNRERQLRQANRLMADTFNRVSFRN
ncbi:hypothetical protein Zmor_025565 [Zophobas morio]|uniref:ALMS motif domain-containing protein n=1 Tax=Zophobas morio TaxID=2755281 RepID=A0AA38HTP9_9CUCU|nr:hypothetical protein Zmor_025565 [Zophobas morio]